MPATRDGDRDHEILYLFLCFVSTQCRSPVNSTAASLVQKSLSPKLSAFARLCVDVLLDLLLFLGGHPVTVPSRVDDVSEQLMVKIGVVKEFDVGLEWVLRFASYSGYVSALDLCSCEDLGVVCEGLVYELDGRLWKGFGGERVPI